MKKTFLLFLALILLLPGHPALAAPQVGVGLSDVIKAVESPFGGDGGRERGPAIVDFQAEFFQESHIASLERMQRGRGEVWLKFDRTRGSDLVPQAKFRWEYHQPTNQEIVSDGRTLWVYLPENNQVIRSDIEDALRQQAENPVTFLTGLGNLSRDFSIRWASPNRDAGGNYIIELRPRRSSPLMNRLLMVIDRDAVLRFDENLRPELRQGGGEVFPLLSTTVFDPNGNSTLIEFRDMRVNRGLPDSMFEFMRPAGVEVVRPGEGFGF